MESSDAETGMVDCAVGTIVWVRRRNGSWWPGKILGPDELSASHLMSPRSGTPVKLLGREDASVDWYNLEKSKRVKPFRCGEFDDCIERAEASQGMPPKKREKYARREDAILHALELEKQVLEKKYGKSGGVQSNGLSTKLLGKDTSITPSRDNGKHVDPSVDDKRKGLSLQSRNDKSPDIRPPSFRGLQDLGAGPIPIPVPFKHKLSSLNGSHRHAAAAADGVSHHENTVTVSSKKLLEKRKRLQEGNAEESVGKRRDRHRPLVQVLQSSAKLPHTNTNTNPHLLKSKADGGEEHREEVVHPAVGIDDPEIAGDNSFDHRETLPDQVDISAPKSKSFPVASLSEDNNTTGSNEDTETDSSGTESLISDTYDAMALPSDEGEEEMEFIPKAFGRQEAHASMSDDNDLSGGGGGVPDDSVAKWQLKGKRNSRSLRKRNSSHWTMMMMGFKGEGGYNNNNNSNSNSNRGGGGLLDMSWDDDDEDEDDDDDDDDDDEGWDDEYKCRMLIDVEVGVQSGYQREHVPMISLMSKLNDKAIVGHPIPVEALQDGSSDAIILADPTPTPTPTPTPWRTAKSRPPHLEEKEDDDDEGSLMNRKGRKSKKQPQRRSTSSSFTSQKIRTLSSIGGTHQQQQSMDMKEAGEGRMMKLKPESLPTAVACIPVKLVFSRLHEELLVARHQ